VLVLKRRVVPCRWEASTDSEVVDIDSPKVPALRGLSPKYVAKHHAEYVQILVAELQKSGSDAPRNIALTGHYGSGKSSVLVKVQEQLAAADLDVINLSLPSLGVGDGRLPKDGNAALDKTNLIQKEIVKQLLYRRKPSDTPASRYNRLDAFDESRAYRRAALTGAVVTCLALLARLPTKVRDALPDEFWPWLNKQTWGSPATTIQWLSLLVVCVLAGMVAMWVQRLLQRLRVTEFAAGSTKVTLSEGSSSFFDEYLDEIVYFFQTSKTEVVIFEDLDRFKDPHIFETLRELNLLLNNAEQTGAKPIRFVYAIRDSIFEQLDALDDEKQPPGTDDQGLAVAESQKVEERRLKSTNRTKFFDLVVPMVPFISHRTSREWIRDELKTVDEAQRPTSQVIDIVSAHLTDMRLIKNICNEFDIFRRRILAADGLTELTADRLFASIVYKNLYLADYEDIRNGRSRLDTLYRAYRDWVATQVAAARSDERVARIALRRLDSVPKKSEQLGTRLDEVVRLTYGAVSQPNTLQISVGGAPQTPPDLRGVDFWRSYLNEQPKLIVNYTNARYPGYAASAELSFRDVQALLGETLDSDLWTQRDRNELDAELTDAVARQRSMTHASMATALAATGQTFRYGSDEVDLSAAAEKLFAGEDVVLDLLRSGLIDENFTLYTTQFPGQGSAAAMNFVMKSVQPDIPDFDYHFGAGEEVDEEDINSVIRTEGPRLFAGQSVYNRELFDYLLAHEPSRLERPIQRLTAGSEQDLEFIDAYVNAGKQVATFMGLLTAEWNGAFDYVIGRQSELVDPALLDAALGGADPRLNYKLSDEQRDTLVSLLPSLRHVTTQQSPRDAKVIADVLKRMTVEIPDLSVVKSPLLTEVVGRSLYRVSLSNLRMIVSNDAGLPLDAIKRGRGADIYPHVMSRLRQYLIALDEAPAVPTVADPGQFAAVLADVHRAEPDLVTAIARRAMAECMVLAISDMPVASWPAIAAAHRLALSSHNVSSYLAQYDIDAELAEWLTVVGEIAPIAGDDLVQLAVSLLNCEALSTETKLRLVSSLDLDPGAIGARDLTVSAHPALGGLVAAGVVADDANAYTCLGKDESAAKEALIRSSANFPEYMLTIPLGASDLLLIATKPVPSEVKQMLLANIERFEDSLGPRGAAGIARWAAASGRQPNAAGLVTLATKIQASDVGPVIELLGDEAAMVDVAVLKAILNALGEPYNQLTEPGRDRPRIPKLPGMEPILERFQTEGIVSKVDFDEMKREFKVSKRHS
jgi:hypothetical protein